MMKLEKDHFYLMIIFCYCSSFCCFCSKLPFFRVYYFLFYCDSGVCVCAWFIAPVPARYFPVFGYNFFLFFFVIVVLSWFLRLLLSRLRLGLTVTKRPTHTQKNEQKKNAENDTARITSDVSLWNMQLARKWMNLLNSALVFSPFFAFVPIPL